MLEAHDSLDIREQIVRIDNMREEALKFFEEKHTPNAEAAKLDRDRRLSPALVVIGIAGSFGGFVAGVIALANLIASAHGRRL